MCVSFHVCFCISVGLSLCVSMCVVLSIFIGLSFYLFVFPCLVQSVCVCVYMCLCEQPCHVYMCTLCVYVCMCMNAYLFPCLFPVKVQACCPEHTFQLSGIVESACYVARQLSNMTLYQELLVSCVTLCMITLINILSLRST